MKPKYLLIVAAGCFLIQSLMAQSDSTGSRHGIEETTKGILLSAAVGIEYRIRAGLAVGGIMPLPIPLEIRKINSYQPMLNIWLEAEIMKTFTDSWALSTGLRMENKGMKTEALVKNYYMKMISDDGEVAGIWNGTVETSVTNSYISLPVLAVWKPTARWGIKFGPYISCLLNGRFSGYARNGYLREGNPVGEKIEIKEAIYDLSFGMRQWLFGSQLGAEWRAFPHLIAAFDLTWGFNSVFRKNVEAVSFDMYPVYGTLSFAYAF
ncbi:MAG: PorT family protein [Bacteroidales bacterium]|nr:PorT family protein [Bacteroidales bacterium]